jgi:hypothetical protein
MGSANLLNPMRISTGKIIPISTARPSFAGHAFVDKHCDWLTTQNRSLPSPLFRSVSVPHTSIGLT